MKEKSLAEMGANVDPAARLEVEDTIRQLKDAIGRDNADDIRRLSEGLSQAAHKITTTAYQNAQGSQGPHAGPGPQETGPSSGQQATGDDDVVDAEYQEVA
jgi:molecular chaperone DnaK